MLRDLIGDVDDGSDQLVAVEQRGVGYPIILTIMLGVSAMLYRGFKRSRWI